MFTESWNSVATTLGVDLASLIGITIFFAGFIFLAKDVKIGLIFYLIAFSLAFMGMYYAGLETMKLLIGVFASLLAMTLSLYTSHSKGGII